MIEYIYPQKQRRPVYYGKPVCKIFRNSYKRNNKKGSVYIDNRMIIRFFNEAITSLGIEYRDRILPFWDSGNFGIEILPDSNLTLGYTVSKEPKGILKINVPRLYASSLKNGFYELVKMFEDDDYKWLLRYIDDKK